LSALGSVIIDNHIRQLVPTSQLGLLKVLSTGLLVPDGVPLRGLILHRLHYLGLARWLFVNGLAIGYLLIHLPINFILNITVLFKMRVVLDGVFWASEVALNVGQC